MPRTERIKSIFGYYHVSARGVNHLTIFPYREDHEKYLRLLAENSQKYGIRITTYCLMSNHVHLVLFDQNDAVSDFMRKQNGQYALYFNKKYDRSGHLFESRFWSDTINSEAQLLRVIRYVLQNPEKAGVCAADEYEWSSYSEYSGKNTITDTSIIRKYFKSEESFHAFVTENEGSQKLFDKASIDDQYATEIIRGILGTDNIYTILKMDKGSRNEALRFMKQKGLSCRQIERITGISKATVSRA